MYLTEIEQLKVYADGAFSLLIVGEQGTGKSYIVKKAFPEDCLTFSCAKNYDSFEASLKEELKKANKKKLLIDNIENLSKEQQAILFEVIATRSGGAFEAFSNENIKCQLIFTSSVSLSQLRLNETYYQPFIDRISQQVIALEPIRKFNYDILKEAYKSVWQKMLFEQTYPYKENAEMLNWLKTLHLVGNFRDLEKIAILHWRFLTFDEGKRTLFNAINELLFIQKEYTQHNVEPQNDFFIHGKKADDMIKAFRKQLILWAKNVYKETPKILEVLEISEKTMYNWENGK